ncbi:MAG: hypothetical protein KTR19_06485 [Hyphomicrobiales bacterium]|nr:hypothetical protein [Hyphomicrobiales bacterium]
MAISRGTVRPPELPAHLIETGSITEPISDVFELNSDERRAVEVFLGLVSLKSLILNYRIEPLSQGRMRLTGKFHAEFSQACVITLEPVPEIVDEPIDAELWPEAKIQEEERSFEDAEVTDDAGLKDPPVPIIAGRADLAGFAIEILSTSMEPYPRRNNAKFDWKDPLSGPDGRALSPFAELKKLKSQN